MYFVLLSLAPRLTKLNQQTTQCTRARDRLASLSSSASSASQLSRVEITASNFCSDRQKFDAYCKLHNFFYVILPKISTGVIPCVHNSAVLCTNRSSLRFLVKIGPNLCRKAVQIITLAINPRLLLMLTYGVGREKLHHRISRPSIPDRMLTQLNLGS